MTLKLVFYVTDQNTVHPNFKYIDCIEFSRAMNKMI